MIDHASLPRGFGLMFSVSGLALEHRRMRADQGFKGTRCKLSTVWLRISGLQSMFVRHFFVRDSRLIRMLVSCCLRAASRARSPDEGRIMKIYNPAPQPLST